MNALKYNLFGGDSMENNLIVKANTLVEARYNLTLNEQKIILYAVSKLNKDSEKFNKISLNVREFSRLLGTTEERYTEIREIARVLRKKEVIIDTDTDELITGWLSSIKYIKDTGEVELEFSENLIPYLLQLKAKFTRYQLKNILYLKNKYSIRIYELLKQYEKIKSRDIGLDELKEVLMISDMYKDFRNFERAVIKKATDEINTYTDLTITYEKLKRGRTIIGIKFYISSKEDDSYIEYLNKTYSIKDFKLKSGLKDERFNSKQIMELYEAAIEKLGDDFENENDIFEYIRLNYLFMINKKSINNKFTYLKKSLQEDYAVARGQIKFNIRV